MEFVREARPCGAFNLVVPGLSFGDSDVDDEEDEMVIGIRPKSSPLPRRKTSSSSEDDLDLDLPRFSSRRVSFADAKGLHLVQVKKFDVWDTPKVPGCSDSMQGDGSEAGACYSLTHQFCSPLPPEELYRRVQEQKVELEAIDLLPGTTMLKGLIRVSNVSYDKMVYIRTSLDSWASHFDLLAQYLPGFSDGVTDCFSFQLLLVPPFGEQGARVDFCLRYETPIGTFWANNNGDNYVVFCHQRPKPQTTERPQGVGLCKKSCLKAVRRRSFSMEDESSQEDSPSLGTASAGVLKHRETAALSPGPVWASQPGTSEDHQELPVDSSRQQKKRALRVAQARDYFAQRDGKSAGGESEASFPEMPPPAGRGGPPWEKSNLSGAHPLSVAHGQPGGSGVIPEAPPTSIRPSPQVQCEIPPTQDGTSNVGSDQPESPHVGTTSGMVERQPTEIPDSSPLPRVKPTPPKRLHATRSPSRREGRSARQTGGGGGGVNDAAVPRPEQEPDTVSFSAPRAGGLVSCAGSFSFGTVVAPLYPQVFGMVGAEHQTSADSLRRCRPAETLPSNQGHHHTQEEPEPSVDTSDSDAPTEPISRESLGLQGKVLEASLVHDPQGGAPVQTQPRTGAAPNHPGQETASQTETPQHVLSPPAQGHTASDGDPQLSPTAPTSGGVTSACHLSATPTTLAPAAAGVCLDQGGSESPRDPGSRCMTQSTPAELDHPPTEDQNASVGSCGTAGNSRSVGGGLRPQLPTTLPETVRGASSRGGSSEETSGLGKEEPRLSGEDEGRAETPEPVLKRSWDQFDEDGDVLQGAHEEDTVASKKEEEEEEEDREIKVEVVKPGADPEQTAGEGGWERGVEGREDEEPRDEEQDRNQEINEEVEEDTRVHLEELEEEKESRTVEIDMTGGGWVGGMVGEGDGAQMESRQGVMEKEELDDIIRDQEEENTEEEAEMENILQGEEEYEVELEGIEDDIGGAEDLCEEGEVEQEEEKETDLREKGEGETGLGCEVEIQLQEEKLEEKEEEEEIPDYKEETRVDEAGDEEITAEELKEAVGGEREEQGHDSRGLVERSDADDLSPHTRLNGAEDSSPPAHGVQAAAGEGGARAEHTEGDAPDPAENDPEHQPSMATPLSGEEEHGLPERSSCVLEDQAEEDSDSTASLSDDEVELYVHRLRAAHRESPPQAVRNPASKGLEGNTGKRPSVARSKHLLLPMPSIHESLDEEQPASIPQDHQEVTQPAGGLLPPPAEEEPVRPQVAQWRRTFTCTNVAQKLLYGALAAVFLLVAFHYDFLACFALYLMSAFWLCVRRDKQPAKSRTE